MYTSSKHPDHARIPICGCLPSPLAGVLCRRSPDATLSMSSDEAPKGACLATTLTGSLLLLFAIWLFVSPTLARAQSTGSQPTQVTPPPAQSEIKENSAELATHDEPTTFKVNVRLVLVRAVVRDLQGHAVGNLNKEDFQVFDKGKPQVISQFEVEQPGNSDREGSSGFGRKQRRVRDRHIFENWTYAGSARALHRLSVR